MNLRIGYILLTVGLLALILLSVVRLGREREFYELQLRQQADAIEAGLREKWKNHLLNLARLDRLPKDFLLQWDRLGRVLHTPFYPQPGIQLDWAEYREAVKNGDAEARRTFLEKALRLKRSWDRLLALDEWRALAPEVPPAGGQLVDFERAQAEPEARDAYRTLFDYFESGRDFTFANENVDFDHVFFRTTSEGELEGFLPSIASARASALKGFMAENRISRAEFGETALDIRFPQFQNAAAHGFRRRDTVLLGASVIFLIAGALLTAAGLREQRALLVRRVSFLNQVVHELKTPLAGLRLSAQLIRRSGPSERNLQAIDQSIMRLDRLFDDIVQINRPETRADLKVVGSAEVNELVRNLVENEFPGVATIAGEASDPVRTEPGRLRVLLRNLISNGVKYGERVTITISKNAESGAIEVNIRDNGPGVSVKDAPKIFDEFFRAESARMAESGGLGLGLSLVRKIASELSTEVRLTNAGEEGANFRFNLPIAQSAESGAK